MISKAISTVLIALWLGVACAAQNVGGIGLLKLDTVSVPNAIANAPYNAPLLATGGVPPYTWTAAKESVQGGLPQGLAIVKGSSAITGTTSQVGSFPFLLIVNDSAHHTQWKTLILTVQSQASFTLSASPASLTIQQGGQGNSSISAAISGGLNSAINLSASGAPAEMASRNEGSHHWGFSLGDPTRRMRRSITTQYGWLMGRPVAKRSTSTACRAGDGRRRSRTPIISGC